MFNLFSCFNYFKLFFCADNLDVTPGTGATVAADLIAGALHQRVKVTVGADGTNDGDVSAANPLPVVQTGTPGLPTGAATAAKQLADGHNVVVTGCALPTGAATAAKQLADGHNVAVASIAAGTALIGKVGIDQTTPGTTNAVVEASASAIKTAVEALDNSVDGNYLNVNVNLAGTDAPSGAGTEAGVLRVTLPTDGTGKVTVVSGTAANCKVEATIAAAQSIGAVCTNAGTFAVQAAQATAGNLNCTEASASAIKTAVELIDNAVYVDDADWTGDTSSHLLVGGVYEAAPQTVTSGDVAPISLNVNGAVRVVTSGGALAMPNIDSYSHAAFNLAAGANQVLVSSAANKQIWVYGIGFSVNVAGTVSFQDEDDTAVTGIMQIGATGGMVVAPSGNFCMPIWKLATDKDLEVDVVTSELDGWIDYALVSV